MARVEIPAPGDLIMDDAGNVQQNVTVSLTFADTATDVTHYSALTGGSSATGGLTTSSDGTIVDGSGNRRYIDDGKTLDLTIGGRTSKLQPVAARAGLGVDVESYPHSASPSASGSVNHTAITNAITTAGILGTHVVFPTKGATYAIDDVIVNPGVKMVGENVTVDGSSIAAAVAGSTQFAMKVEGSTSGSALAATSALTAGSPTCAFPTATLAAGDVLLIASSTQLYMDGVTVGTELRQELRRVKSVDSGSSLTLTEALRFSYDSGATTTAQKLNMVDRPRVEGVNFLMGGTGKIHNGILFTYCEDPTVRNVGIDGCEDTGLQFSYCWGGSVENCDIANATSPLSVTTTGYGVVSIDATRDLKIGGKNRIRNCRHAVAGGSCSVDVSVFGNDFEGNGIGSGSTLDCHEPCFGWVFDFNRISGGLNGGIGIRGQNCKARWNWIRDCASHGIVVKGLDGNPAGILDTDIIGNDIEDTGGAGIRYEGTATCRVVGGQCHSNRLKNNNLNNLTVLLTDDLEIGHNVYDTPVGSGNDGNNIRIVGSSTSDRCESIIVRGGVFKNTPRCWLKADFALDLTVDSPYVETNVNNTLLSSCTNARVITPTGPAISALSSVSNTNTNFTQTLLVSATTIYHTGTLTADRIISLSLTQNMYNGGRFRIVRTGAGAFNLNIANGVSGSTLKALTTGTWAEFEYDDTNWKMIAAGAL